MQRITKLWKSGIRGKLLIGCGSLLVLLFACLAIIIAIPSPSTTRKATETPTPVVAKTATAALKTTAAPAATNTPKPTDIPRVSGILYVSAGGDGVYIRSAPDREARVKVWPDGTAMRLVEKAPSGWAKVQDPDGYVGYIPLEYLTDKIPPTPTPVVSTPSGECQSRIWGRVSAGEGGEPNVTVEIKGGGWSIKSISNTDGLYGFAGLCAGQYTLTVATAGESQTVTVDGSNTVKLDFTLTPTSTKMPPSGCPQGCTWHKPGCDIKGNVSYTTGEKVYHVPGGTWYDATVIDPRYGERWFCTEAEAVANGWRRSSE